MESQTTMAIATVKQELRLNEWSSQIKARQESGLTVQKWCAENGISPKTYYYRLRKVREQCVDSAQTIVPMSVPSQRSDICVEKNGLHISLPADIPSDILLLLVKELC